MAGEITRLLAAHRDGDGAALDQLTESLYPELKRLAASRSRNSAEIGATTLVGETFIRLLSGGALTPEDRGQFFALAATIMRRIVVDEIRHVLANKRAHTDTTFTDSVLGDDAHEKAEFLLQVDQVLGQLEAADERLARVFECRYFAGLTTEETAEATGVSSRTVERLWSESRKRVASMIDESQS
ncbi:MAG: ECF-type sigma factor [Pseudomonadota bacterium]